ARVEVVLKRKDCQGLPGDQSTGVPAWAVPGSAIGTSIAAVVFFPVIAIDLVGEPEYAALVAKYDPDRVRLGEPSAELDQRLGKPQFVSEETHRGNGRLREWRAYLPGVHPTLFQDAGCLQVEIR